MSFFGDGRTHHVGEVGQSHHDVHSDDTGGLFPGFVQFFLQSQDRGFEIVRVFPAVQQSQSGAGDHSHTSLVGYGRGQSGKGDSYPHSSLNDGYGGAQISYFERFHISVAVS